MRHLEQTRSANSPELDQRMNVRQGAGWVHDVARQPSVLGFASVCHPCGQSLVADWVLLRENYRAGGKVKSHTLANLTSCPDAKVAALRRVLKGDHFATPVEEMRIECSLPARSCSSGAPHGEQDRARPPAAARIGSAG